MSKTIRKTLVAMIAALTIGTGLIAVSAPAQARMGGAGKSEAHDMVKDDAVKDGLDGTGFGAIVGLGMLGGFVGSALDSANAGETGAECRQVGACPIRGRVTKAALRIHSVTAK